MKLSKKIISLVLSAVMVFSMASAALAGTLKTDTYNTVEKLIQTDSLGVILESLIKDINDAKTQISGTVLRLLFTFLRFPDLSEIIAGKNVSTLTDDEAASILIQWTDKILKEKTADLNDNKTYKLVVNAIKVASLGSAKIDLSSTKNALATVYSLGNMKAVLSILGDAKKLNVKALKDVKKKTDLQTLYAVIEFIKDNTDIIKKAINGKLDLGIDALNDMTEDVMKSMKNLPLFIKSCIYLIVNPYAAVGQFSPDAAAAKGEWGTSDYAGYTADELLAAGLIRSIKNDFDPETVTYGFVPKGEADAALELSFYEILTTYAGELFDSYAVNWLNASLPGFIKSISVTDEIKAVFKDTIPEITDETIADLIEGAKETGVLGQVNNLLVKIAEFVLKPAEFTKLGLAKGGNDKLNANLEKVARLVLPLMANKTVSDNLGFDFTAFTKEAVQKMSLEDMAVAVLKIFYDGWFHTNEAYNAAAVASADSMEQMLLLALYYTSTNKNWLPISVDFSAYEAKIFNGDKVNAVTTEDAEDLAISMGLDLGVGMLKFTAQNTNYDSDIKPAGQSVMLGDINGSGDIKADDARLALRMAVGFDDSETEPVFYPAAADIDGNDKVEAGDARLILRGAVGLEELTGTVNVGGGVTWRDYVDDVSDWALNYIKGTPAIVRTSNVTTERNVYDPYQDGAFNKLNLVLNELIDFSFLNGVSSDTYKLDLEKLVFDGLLKNFYNFDVAGLLGVFAVNDNGGNILNQKFVPSVLGVADRIVTALFKPVEV
ncbi:MAG: hypothetical protein IJT27_06275 [Clostridia bacterium]|nr:hypothetical protein [Clostridia bacterium]